MPRPPACLDLGDFERGQIVGLKTAGWSNRRTANFVGCSKDTVRQIFNTYSETGNVNRHRENCGSHRKTTSEQDQALVSYVQDQPHTSGIRAANALHLNIGSRTVRRRWNQFGFNSYWAARKEPLTLQGKENRVGFCLQHLPLEEDEWKKFVFTDESCVSLMKDGRVRVWRRKGERLSPQFIRYVQRSGRFSVPVWGWCSGAGVGNLTQIDGRLNCQQYTDILENIFIPQVRGIFGEESINFVQDQSPVHTAKSVKTWFQAHQQDITLVNLPPRSPDLNIIENAWALLKNRVDTTDVINSQMLWERTEEAWDTLAEDIDYWETLARSMPRRLQLVLQMGGGHTRY